jgi:anaerobic magnesium-protoporphyrin IX monomethyl ester cyclase
MKVLLLSPPYLPDYMRNARCDFVSLSATQWFPIWLGYCGCFLEKHGHNVKFVDSPAYGLNHDQTEAIFLEYKPDLLVVYTGTKSEDNDISFTERLIEKWNCPAILVGPYFSIDPIKTLSKSTKLKFGIESEFELPILEFLEGRNFKEIKNLVWRDGDEIHTNEDRPYLSGDELDEFPFVSDFFNRHLNFKYYNAPSEYHPFMDIMTGRGCQWGLCTYCLWVHSFIKGRTYNTRSIENVVDEFEFIKKHIPKIRSVMIQDDTFTTERAMAFSEAKLKRGNKLIWSCYARGNMDYDTLKLMKQSGCRNLHVGFESGDPQVLVNIKKGISKERMTKFAEDAKKAGLQIHGDFAIGFPGETTETINETVQWACQIRPHTAQFQLMIPFPGTPFYEELERKGWLKNGAPNYPEMSMNQLEEMAKKAYRSFYFSLPFLKSMIRHPHELFFSRLKTYCRAIPAVFWKKWDVR